MIRMTFVVVVFLFATASTTAQAFHPDSSHTGIEWTTGLTWKGICDKAAAERKYIFVDCFSTWCVPCKWMDKVVYPNDTVGNLLNSSFISVKVQFDTTKKDNEYVQKWYRDAASIRHKYNVNAYPTFLFLTPDGQLLFKDVGAKDVVDFTRLVKVH